MSGRELDPDGTDSYHPEHPWEQVGHPLYRHPDERSVINWPPRPAQPVGPHEESLWKSLPLTPRKKPTAPTSGPGFTF